MSNAQLFYHQLVQSLQLLSADFSVQIDALPPFVEVADEIALIYHECVLLSDQMLDAGLISKDQLDRVVNIDERLAEMSNEESYWTLEALQHNPEWDTIRTQAKKILVSMEVPQSEPDLSWITFVKGADSTSDKE